MNNLNTKTDYRNWAKDIRAKLGKERLMEISLSIVNKIRSLEQYKSSTHVMSYIAKELEISLSELFSDRQKFWYVPVLKSEILIAPYVHGRTKLIRARFGILEPEVVLDKKIKLDLIFVPGLCFDKNRNRIGFGRGYYDQFLKFQKKPFKIGCCPKECLVDKLPVNELDEPVDLVITQSG